jgi:cell division protein ZapA
MDSPSQGIRVTIFGDEYSLKGDVDAETTRQVAAYVDRKILELQGKSASRDKLKIAILSALNIAGELFDHKSKAEQQQKGRGAVGETRRGTVQGPARKLSRTVTVPASLQRMLFCLILPAGDGSASLLPDRISFNRVFAHFMVKVHFCREVPA